MEDHGNHPANSAACTILYSTLQRESKERIPGGNADELPAAHQICDRIGADYSAKVLAPHLFSRFGVQREEVTLVAASEHELTCSRKDAGPRFCVELVVPNALAGLRIERANGAVTGVIRKIDEGNASDVPIARGVLLLAFAIDAAVLPRGKVEKLGQRVVAG